MTTRMRISIVTGIALLTFVAAPSASAQVERSSEDKSPPALAGSVPLERVIAAVAKRTGKKFIVDPRLRGDVTMVGQEPTSVDYPTLLLILRVHGFAALEQGGYVEVIPDANIRQYPVPVTTGKESYTDGEYVNKVIMLRNVPAMQLVPLLRPVLQQAAHLVALPCKNALLMVDTFANVKRVEQIARALDVGDAYVPPSCSVEWPPR